MNKQEQIRILKSFIRHLLSIPINIHSPNWVNYTEKLIKAQHKLYKLIHKSHKIS